MTFWQAQLSLQLIAEQHVGSAIRRGILEEKAKEDAAAANAAAAIQRMTDGTG